MNANPGIYHKISTRNLRPTFDGGKGTGIKVFGGNGPTDFGVSGINDSVTRPVAITPRKHGDATQPYFIKELDAKLFELAAEEDMSGMEMSSETVLSTSLDSGSSGTPHSWTSRLHWQGLTMPKKPRASPGVIRQEPTVATSQPKSLSTLETAVESALSTNGVRRVSRKVSGQHFNQSHAQSHVIQKRKSYYALEKPKNKKIIRHIQSKLDLIDNSRMTHFPSVSIDSDRLSIVENYIAPPTPPDELDEDLASYNDLSQKMCFGCHKLLPTDLYIPSTNPILSATSSFQSATDNERSLRYLCGKCIDSRDPMFDTFSQVLKIEMQESLERPGDTFYVFEENNNGWFKTLVKRFRWRWRLKGLLTDLKD
jgi:hypothetical protein